MKHAEGTEELIAQAAGLGVALDEARAARLLDFEDLLLERAVPLGFVAESDAGRIRERHLLDCLRASGGGGGRGGGGAARGGGGGGGPAGPARGR
ncbi:MAG: hypothetical protein ACKOKE_08040, partial [Actinomycetota bacterium]